MGLWRDKDPLASVATDLSVGLVPLMLHVEEAARAVVVRGIFRGSLRWRGLLDSAAGMLSLRLLLGAHHPSHRYQGEVRVGRTIGSALEVVLAIGELLGDQA